MVLSVPLIASWCCIYAVLVGWAHGITTVEIDFEFDPCSLKQCAEDEVCRAVKHAQLLEIPVAVCVKTATRPATESGQCKSHSIGTNILNCKTLSEWVEIGDAQCSSADEGQRYELDKRSIQAKFVCHQKTGEEYKYLSAEFKCCKKETPSVLTVATPVTTTTASGRPKEDGWTNELPPSEETIATASLSTKPYTITTESSTDTKPTEPNQHESFGNDAPTGNNDTPTIHDEQPFHEEGDNSKENDNNRDSDTSSGISDSAVMFIVIFIIACCVLLVIGVVAYMRFLARKKSLANKKAPTVFVNQSCVEYKEVFEDKQPLVKNIYY